MKDDTATSSDQRPTRARQTLLTFGSNGMLSTKMPLTNPTPRSDTARMSLADVAKETVHLLPGLLATRPDVGTNGIIYKPSDLSPIQTSQSPKLPAATIQVIDGDTIDVALALQQQVSTTSSSPVCVLNMANARHAGGGFMHGAVAQEEALCYRSSLYFTLKHRHYPIPEEGAIFSPKVLVIRDSMSNGHDLMDLRTPANLPIIGVVSAAAICQPRVKKDAKGAMVYASARDRDMMRKKMKTILRVCMINGCRRVVLGAFGCGAFANPPAEVAELWKEVLTESEFGGWWEAIVFAVLDGKRDDNFGIFKMVLGGLKV
jgi:uncharacterized protein (TIGR02452 family)